MTNPPTALPIPSAIQRLADTLAEDSGGTSEITHVEARRWRVTTSTDRVAMWVEYEVLSHGRLRWAGTQLSVDGKCRDRADSYSDLLSIYRDPDGKNPEPDPVYTDVDPVTAPPLVRKAYARVAPVVPNLPAGARVVVRRAGRRWMVAIETDRMSMRYLFITPLMNPNRPERDRPTVRTRRPIELSIDGADMTDEVNGRIDKALAMMVYHAAPAAPPASGPAPAAVNDSVRVRRQSVIRI